MLNLYVERMIRERGTIMGLLKAENVNDSEFDEQVKVCGTVEREADCLPRKVSCVHWQVHLSPSQDAVPGSDGFLPV